MFSNLVGIYCVFVFLLFTIYYFRCQFQSFLAFFFWLFAVERVQTVLDFFQLYFQIKVTLGKTWKKNVKIKRNNRRRRGKSEWKLRHFWPFYVGETPTCPLLIGIWVFVGFLRPPTATLIQRQIHTHTHSLAYVYVCVSVCVTN